MFLLLVTGLSLFEVVIAALCDKTFSSSSGTVSSPDYGLSNYANNLFCQYDIRVASGNAVSLQWDTFDVEGKMPSCNDDYVEIFVGCGRHSIGKYCSENSDRPFDVYSPDNCLRLKFRSDSSGTGRGFRASYYTISYITGTRSLPSSCSGTISKRSNSGVISSPMWPRVYPSFRDCYWKIEVGHNKGVRIAFMDFHLDYDSGCVNDKVKVKGGQDDQSYESSPSTLKGSICGSENPFYLTSSEEQVWIRFKSDSFSSRRGFVAGYVTYSSTSGSSGSSGGAIVAQILVPIIVLAFIGGCFYYSVVYHRRARLRRATRRQTVMATQVSVASQQAVVHHPPPPAQPGYGPPPPASYGAPPPMGYAPPPPAGSAPPSQPGVAPPPYSEVVAGAPYPQQDKSVPYPPPGLTQYPPGQPGRPAPYPLGQPGGMPPYLPGQPHGAAPYPPEPTGGTAPYHTASPGGAPYPPN